MMHLKRKVAMCLMAHPDDCEFLAMGTLALLHEAGWQVHIVTMTPGDCGSMELGPIQIARVRRDEAARAAKVINACYHCLEARDLYVTYDEKTLRRAVALTRQIGPTLMFTHSLVDYMMDHEVTARIARGISFGYAVPNACPGPIPAGSMVPYLYYADPVEGTDLDDRPVHPTTCVDITTTMGIKTESLTAHASQRNWLLEHHGMDRYVETMQQWSARRGRQIGVNYAEGFRQHRGHAYPADCILATHLEGLVHTPDPHDAATANRAASPST